MDAEIFGEGGNIDKARCFERGDFLEPDNIVLNGDSDFEAGRRGQYGEDFVATLQEVESNKVNCPASGKLEERGIVDHPFAEGGLSFGVKPEDRFPAEGGDRFFQFLVGLDQTDGTRESPDRQFVDFFLRDSFRVVCISDKSGHLKGGRNFLYNGPLAVFCGFGKKILCGF